MARIAVIKVDVDTGDLVDWGVEGGAKVDEGGHLKPEIAEVSVKCEKSDKYYKRLNLLFRDPAAGGCLYWDGTKWVKWC